MQRPRPQVAVEAHVDPGVAAAAKVAQQHGDGESHVGGICREKSRSFGITAPQGAQEGPGENLPPTHPQTVEETESQRGERMHLGVYIREEHSWDRNLGLLTPESCLSEFFNLL